MHEAVPVPLSRGVTGFLSLLTRVHMGSIRFVLAACCCCALVFAYGCVSRDTFTHVSQEREQLSAQLARARSEGDATRQQVRVLSTELSQTQKDRDARREEVGTLSSDLSAERARTIEMEARAAGAEERLGEAQIALQAAEQDRVALEETRRKL